MQAINLGDVYFCESPFTNSVGAKADKKLSYLLGTVSQRPVIVIRPPMAWDIYGQVEVLPALSYSKPAITFKMYDRFGYLSEADYSFAPHTTHSIPVNRLGRYIGRLSDEELSELMYAYHWIHDTAMQQDKSNPVPECYKEYMFENYNKHTSGNSPRNAKHKLTVGIKEYDITCSDGTLTNQALDFDYQKAINPAGLERLMEELEYPTPEEPKVPVAYAGGKIIERKVGDMNTKKYTNVIPKTEELDKMTKDVGSIPEPIQITEKKPEPKEVKKEVVVETVSETNPEVSMVKTIDPNKYPPSIFPVELIDEYGSKFRYDKEYFEDKVPLRDPKVLTDEEVKMIIGTSCTSSDYNTVYDYFLGMKPIDRDLFGVRLPTYVMSKLCSMPMKQAACLKRLCNAMYDMSVAEYNIRLAKFAKPAADAINNKAEEAQAIRKVNQGGKFAISVCKKYLNSKSIYNIPDTYVEDFLSIPEYMFVKVFQGKNAKQEYKKAVEFYKAKKHTLASAT